MENSRKRKVLSIVEKVEIITALQKGEKIQVYVKVLTSVPLLCRLCGKIEKLF